MITGNVLTGPMLLSVLTLSMQQMSLSYHITQEIDRGFAPILPPWLNQKMRNSPVTGWSREQDTSETTQKQSTKSPFQCPSSKGNFPYQSDCSKFYRCYKFVPTLFKCDEGLLFHELYKFCMQEDIVDCGDRKRPVKTTPELVSNSSSVVAAAEVQFKCPSRLGNYPNIGDCEYFFRCSSSKHQKKKCPKNQKFDKYSQKCLPKEDAVCATKATDIINRDNPGYKCPYQFGEFSYPSDCSEYYLCLFNKAKLKRCESSQLFDSNLRKCQTKAKVNCGSRFNPYEKLTTTKKSLTTITTSKPTSKKTKKPTKTTTMTTRTTKTTRASKTTTTTPRPRTKPDVDVFECPFPYGPFPNPKDCSKFYLCLFGKPSSMTCKPDELFDSESRACKDKDSVSCDTRYNRYDKATTTKSTKKPAKTTTPKTTSKLTTMPTVSSTSTNPSPTINETSVTVQNYTVTSDFDDTTVENKTTEPITTITVSENDTITASPTEVRSTKETSTESTVETQSTTANHDSSYATTLSDKTDETVSMTLPIGTLEEDVNSTKSETETSTFHDTTPVRLTPTVTESDSPEETPEGTTTSTSTFSSSETTDGTSETTQEQSTESPFQCPSRRRGMFPYQSDCSKYYKCDKSVPTLMKCDENLLFDESNNFCMQEDMVDCRDRERPIETTLLSTDETSTESTAESSTQNEIVSHNVSHPTTPSDETDETVSVMLPTSEDTSTSVDDENSTKPETDTTSVSVKTDDTTPVPTQSESVEDISESTITSTFSTSTSKTPEVLSTDEMSTESSAENSTPNETVSHNVSHPTTPSDETDESVSITIPTSEDSSTNVDDENSTKPETDTTSDDTTPVPIQSESVEDISESTTISTFSTFTSETPEETTTPIETETEELSLSTSSITEDSTFSISDTIITTLTSDESSSVVGDANQTTENGKISTEENTPFSEMPSSSSNVLSTSNETSTELSTIESTETLTSESKETSSEFVISLPTSTEVNDVANTSTIPTETSPAEMDIQNSTETSTLDYASTESSEMICPRPNGFFAKKNSKCKMYYECRKGVPKTKTCPYDELFNETIGRCDFAGNFECS